jgi:hypothetical protein
MMGAVIKTNHGVVKKNRILTAKCCGGALIKIIIETSHYLVNSQKTAFKPSSGGISNAKHFTCWGFVHHLFYLLCHFKTFMKLSNATKYCHFVLKINGVWSLPKFCPDKPLQS